jgi:hypothetical protein
MKGVCKVCNSFETISDYICWVKVEYKGVSGRVLSKHTHCSECEAEYANYKQVNYNATQMENFKLEVDNND